MAGNPCPHGRLACAFCKPPRTKPPRRCANYSRPIGRYGPDVCTVCASLGIEAPSLFATRT